MGWCNFSQNRQLFKWMIMSYISGTKDVIVMKWDAHFQS